MVTFAPSDRQSDDTVSNMTPIDLSTGHHAQRGGFTARSTCIDLMKETVAEAE